MSWRWTPTATLTNEVRGGFNLTYGYFLNAQGNVPNIVTRHPFTDPVNEFQAQGRTTNTYNLRTMQRGSMAGTTYSSDSTTSTSA